MRHMNVRKITAMDQGAWKAATKAAKMLHESTMKKEREQQEKRKRREDVREAREAET